MELLLGAVAGVACGVALWLALARRRTARRLERDVTALITRLGVDAPGPARAPEGGDASRALTHLARAVDAALQRSATAEGHARAVRGVLDALPLGVVVASPEGPELLRNRQASELAGTRPAPALVSGATAELLAAASAGRPGSRRLELHGPRRTLSLLAVPLEGGGGAVVIEDVSDRQRLEAVRRDFVANVSHELKTPVAALGLLAETLVGEDDPAVVRRLGGRMQDEAFRVSRIIDELLDLSRLEGAATERHGPVPVRGVFAAAADQLRPTAEARRISISVDDVPASWAARGEHRQLVSAVANLLENAVKYSHDGSSVELRARIEGAMIALVVEDHGVGIRSTDLDRIFERFYRVDRGRGRDTGGTGLGLSIVRHVATNHGGEVVVESVEGEGSVFTLRLPADAGVSGGVAEAG